MAGHASTQAPVRGRQNVFQVARELYGAAFEPKSRAKVGEAMADWAELSEAEQSFTLGHLLYLNLYAQASTLKVLREIRDVVLAVDDAVQTLADGSAQEEAGSDEEPPVDDDAFMPDSFDEAPETHAAEEVELPDVTGQNTVTVEAEVSHAGE